MFFTSLTLPYDGIGTGEGVYALANIVHASVLRLPRSLYRVVDCKAVAGHLVFCIQQAG